MRIRTLCFLAGLWLALPAAYGQSGGVAEGRLVNGTDPTIVCSGVELDVVSLTGGMSIVKSGVTDGAGKFRIDGLPVDQQLMVRATYKDANYHARLSFGDSGRASADVEVYESTRSPAGIRSEPVRIAFQLAGDRLRSLETWTFHNETKPPRTYAHPEGTFRFSKAAGIAEVPRLSVVGPGSSMPLVQSALESADGQSYYVLYPLRPGTTTFEIEQQLPYEGRAYTYRKKFFAGAPGCQIGLIPADMALSAPGFSKLETNTQQNFSVYSSGAVKAGSEVVWSFSGGTPAAEAAPEAGAPSGETRIRPMPTSVGRNALVLGPAFLIGFIAVLWFAIAKVPESSVQRQDSRMRDLRERREQLLDYLSSLDHRQESGTIGRREYNRLREPARRQLRRVMLLLKK